MSALDIILLACFLPAFWTGFRKGLIAQLMSLLSLILSIWVSWRFCGRVAGWLGSWIEVSPAALKVAAYVLIFICIGTAARLLCLIIEKMVKFVMLGWLNRLGGIVLAAFVTALALGLVIMLFNSLNISLHLVKDETLEGCVVYVFLKDFAYAVFPFMKEMLLP